MSAHPNKNLSGDMALSYLPAGRYVLTSAYDGARAGVLVHWVQPCAEEPALLAVSARRGHCVEPLIRDSRAFAICVVRAEDRLLVRKFQSPHPPDETTDPFDSLDVETFSTGSPVLTRSVVAYDCEVVRHFDLEADHELYIGQIVAACVYDPSVAVGPTPRAGA